MAGRCGNTVMILATLNICALSYTTQIVFHCSNTYRTIDCTNVGIRSLHAGHYPLNYTELDHLYVGSNNLTDLDPDVFLETTGITCLELSNNLLETLHHRLFFNLTKLYYLYLTNNRLKSLSDSRLFASQGELVVLFLSSNELSYLNVSVLRPLRSLRNITLSGNRFVCDCQLRPTVMWFEELNLITGATCQVPTLGESWSVLKSSANCLEVPTSTYSSYVMPIVLVILFLAFVGSAVAIYCRRRKRSQPDTTSRLWSNLAYNENEPATPPTPKCQLSVKPDLTNTYSQVASNSDGNNQTVIYEEMENIQLPRASVYAVNGKPEVLV